MSPIAQPPSRGYNDWQRIGNYDTGLLYQNTLTNSNANFLGPILDVSRFAYLSGTMNETQSMSTVAVQWYSDDIQTQFMGQVELTLVSNIVPVAQLRVPNLGPFCVVEQSVIGVTRYTSTVNIFATNRVHPLELIPQFAPMIDRQAQPLGASSSAIDYPNGYYSGPAQLAVNCTQNVQVAVRILSIVGTWDICWASPVITANNWFTAVFYAPLSAWRVETINQTAVAATYYTIVLPATTGSS